MDTTTLIYGYFSRQQFKELFKSCSSEMYARLED